MAYKIVCLEIFDELLEHLEGLGGSVPGHHVPSGFDGSVLHAVELGSPTSNLRRQSGGSVCSSVVPRLPLVDDRALEAENPRFGSDEVDDGVSVSRIHLNLDVRVVHEVLIVRDDRHSAEGVGGTLALDPVGRDGVNGGLHVLAVQVRGDVVINACGRIVDKEASGDLLGAESIDERMRETDLVLERVCVAHVN